MAVKLIVCDWDGMPSILEMRGGKKLMGAGRVVDGLILLKKTSCMLFPLAIIAIAVLPANVVWAQEFVTDGLMGFWTLDEDSIDGKTVHDVRGENHGEIGGDPAMVEGKINKALEFNGTGDHVQIPDMGNEVAVTVELWAKTYSIRVGGLVSTFDPAQWKPGTVHFRFVGNENWSEVGMKDGGLCYFGDDIEIDRWYHMAYTSDTSEDELKLYVDGELMDEAISGAAPNNLASLRIGSENEGRYFHGILDEVRIYNRALSADEIKRNYSATSNAIAVNPSGKLATLWGKVKL